MGQGASGSMYSSRGPAPFSNVDGDDIVTLNCATYLDVFVIKLDSSDDYVWHWKDWGAEKGGGVQIIANNNGDVFVTYYINGAQPEICGSSTTTVGGSEVYVLVKLDSTGTCQWFYKSEDLLIDSNWTNRLGVDSNNNIYMNTVAYTYNPIGYYNYSFSILVINDQGVQQNSLSWNTRTYDLVFDTDDNIYLNRIVGITKSSLADLVIN
jgi:aspartate 1-decarboxylase